MDTMVQGKLKDTIFVPEIFLKPRGDETHMSAAGGYFQVEPGAPARLGYGVAFGGQEGVIAGIDQKGGDSDPVDKVTGAAATPVFFGISEPVSRSGVTVIKFAKAT
jgi:hypothetical protein